VYHVHRCWPGHGHVAREGLMKKQFSLILFFLILGCLMSCSQSEKEQKDSGSNEARPVTVITKKHSNDLNEIKTGHMLTLVGANLPFPKENTLRTEVEKSLKNANVKVIETSITHVLVNVYGILKETGAEAAVMKVSYEFNDGIYHRGPILIEALPVSEITLIK
jgi:hypothetical protein